MVLPNSVQQLYKYRYNGDASNKSETVHQATATSSTKTKVGVVGIGCKAGYANDMNGLWEILNNHDSLIKTVCIGEKNEPCGYAALVDEELRDTFDPNFWGMTPAQAAKIDPQARWILEGVWNATIDAHGPSIEEMSSNLKVGLYCGIMNNDIINARDDAGLEFSLNSTGGSIAGLVSHVFGFHGNSIDVNMMCSSGLVCLELAFEALQNKTCGVAFVAAANWFGAEQGFRQIGSVGALSLDGLQDCLGHVPNGYVRGEGMVTIMLQRTCDIKGTGNLCCIIEAVASTHHGRGAKDVGRSTKVSTNVALPTSSSYMAAYTECFLRSGEQISKHDVVYLEMHATGTQKGDMAEIDSVSEFYPPTSTPPTNPGVPLVDFVDSYNIKKPAEDVSQKVASNKKLYVGTNKSIFGHTEPVSGLLSLAKILLAFSKGIMPTGVFITDPNETLKKNEAVHVLEAPVSLAKMGTGLFAITASGMSGTTSHVLICPPTDADFSDNLFSILDQGSDLVMGLTSVSTKRPIP